MRRRFKLRVATQALLLSCVIVAPAAAQQWQAEVQAGRIRAALDAVATDAQTLAAGLSYQAPHSALGFSVGIPTAEAEPLWGALSGSHRLALYRSGFVFGLDLSGSGYLMHDRADRIRRVTDALGRPQLIREPAIHGNAFAAQALPLVGYQAARWQVQARAGASQYSSRFGELERERAVFLSDVQFTLLPTHTLAFIPVVRRYIADDLQHTYAGVSAVAGDDRRSVWVSAGGWPDVDSVGVSWSVGATLRVHKRASLSASGRHDAYDPLYLNPAQTAWSVGLAVRLGGTPLSPLPIPAAYEQGRATIELPARYSPTQPMIAGDFTSWQPRPMQRKGDAWTFVVPLPPGVYNYAFVGADGKWFVPADFPGRKDDGMGGTVAVLVVRK